MKFSRFLDAIEKGLFVSKATLFHDKWEGLLPFYSSTKDSVSENSATYTRGHLEWIYISSWTKESLESYAMWKIYAGDDLSVALVTTSEKLEALYKGIFPNTEAKLNAVEYHLPGKREESEAVECICHASQPIDSNVRNSMIFLFRKHETYVFEKEIRLVCLDQSPKFTSSNPQKCLRLPFANNLAFLDKIIISPTAPLILVDLIQNIISKKILQTKAKVVSSQLVLSYGD